MTEYIYEETRDADGVICYVKRGEVVRCKDCRYSHMTYDGDCKYCDKWKEDGEALYLEGDFYCAYGERKEKCKECWYWSEAHKHCENKGGCQFKPYGEYKDGKEE